MVDLVFIFFLFYFYFILFLVFILLFFILNLGKKCDVASLISFLPPSHMVTSKRNSVNTLFSFVLNTSSNSQEFFTKIAVNMEVNTLRGQFVSSSANSSKSALVLSKTSSRHCQQFCMG